MPAEERKPSAQKADGWRVGQRKKAGHDRPAFLMYMCSGAGNGTRTRDPLPITQRVLAPPNIRMESRHPTGLRARVRVAKIAQGRPSVGPCPNLVPA